MLIIDSQVHFWGANTPGRPWPKGTKPHKPYPFGSNEMLKEMKAAGVDRAIIVPPGWEIYRNDLALAAARTHPDRFAVVGRLDPLATTSRGALATWRMQPGMLGVRLAFTSEHPLRLLAEGHVEWIWREAEAAGVPVYVLIAQELARTIDAVAERYPALKIVMNHLALTGHDKDDEAFRNLDKLLVMAKRPNVAAAASALPCFSTDKYPYHSLHGYIRKAYDAFGPERLFWGTDLTRSTIPYREHVTMFTEEIPWLSTQDKEWIMGRGLAEWMGWQVS